MAAKLALVVEDHADVRELIAAELADAGFRVVVSRNGLQAFQQLAQTEPPDVIVLDLMMPVMDGWRLLEHIASFPQLEKIPVVAISASHGGFTGQPAIKAFLPKPFEPSELVRAVHDVVADAEARRAAGA